MDPAAIGTNMALHVIALGNLPLKSIVIWIRRRHWLPFFLWRKELRYQFLSVSERLFIASAAAVWIGLPTTVTA